MAGARSVFVVSTGRTGTQFLARSFESLGVVARHEPGPFWLRHLSNAYASGHVDDERAESLLTGVRNDLDPNEAYLESSCLVYGLVRPLLDTFTDARVVHVVRDPRSYVRSGLAWGAYRLGGRPLNLLPYRRLAPPQFDPLNPAARFRWVGEDQFARLCWAWSAMNEAMRTQGQGHDRFATVRFEDMTDPAQGPRVLANLAEMLEVDVDPTRLDELTARPVNASSASTDPAWRDWTTARLRRLVELTGDEAAHYDYPVVEDVEAELAVRSG